MEIACEFSAKGACIIFLKGRMNLRDLHEIEAKMKDLVIGRKAVIVDLSSLDFLFSMCLRTLILCAQSLEEKGGKLVIVAATENKYSVLKASGVTKLMPVCRNLAAAEIAVFS